MSVTIAMALLCFLAPISPVVPAAASAVASTPSVTVAAASGSGHPRVACRTLEPATLAQDAADLLADRYTFRPHETVQLSHDLRWSEDPYGDRNWRFQFHALRYVRVLIDHWLITGDRAARDRAIELAKDWAQDNPRVDPPSDFSWNDHSTAWRAMTLVCLAEVTDIPDWLLATLRRHGTALADPAFYVGRGNHALNQALGLLEIGCLLGRHDWSDLARQRIGALIVDSVDSQGVTNEQSIEYQQYNYAQYQAAGRRLTECGLAKPAAFDRVARMPLFLAHATLPNGQYETIGDTGVMDAIRFPGTAADFAATKGATGTVPTTLDKLYASSGWAFARTGWGTRRPYADEVHTTLRFGPPQVFHGHRDHGSVTLYGYGRRLLVDPGKYSYDKDAWRTWFIGRTAHNVVTVDGATFRTTAATRLVAHRTSSRHTDTWVSSTAYAGVTSQRRVVFSKSLGFLVVEDRLSSTETRRYRQLWHLAPGAAPVIGSSGVLTRMDRGNLVIRQLIGAPTTRILEGRTDPIQGWVSMRYDQRSKAPVVEATTQGRSVRYLTLIVPGAAQPKVRIDALRLTSTGYTLTVTIDGRTERVTVTSTSSSITSG